MHEKVLSATLWVAYTNTDLTEGRGSDMPIAVCWLKSTAIRLSKKKYVQGSDGPVRPIEAIEVNGKWYVPMAGVNVIDPSPADVADQERMDKKEAAIKKAIELGLTPEDLKFLSST